MAEEKQAPKTDRRDKLIDIETAVQKRWTASKIYEVDAPADKNKPKFFATFPYPYMNGILHLGHAFTLAKVDVACRYQRLLGKQVLFPFGFHCTGAPICGAASKLRQEIIAFGNPPIFPIEVEGEEKVKEETVTSGEPKRRQKGKVAKKKSKHSRQWNILLEMGVAKEEVPKFQDPQHWLGYFPPFGKEHLQLFGLATDWRRSFITTDANPYYDAFIRWQFNTLKKMNKCKFGKRLSVYSPLDGQVCADHDRSEGEGVGIFDYTLIKIKLLKPYPKALQKWSDKEIFLPAATLRPETMYGQTNAMVLPDGEYGVFKITENEVFVMADRAALNMTFQEIAPATQPGKPVKLGSCTGWDLLGCAISSPLAQYEKMYVYPLMTIKMDKGTAIVTSVPSDAPDDWAALNDLKKKKPMREKFNLTDEMVLPFEVVPIINIPGMGNQAAADMCVKMKVKSQNDKDKLKEIKDKCYTEGFAKGVMLVGDWKGKPVKDAKPLIKAWMIENNLALPYSETESRVVSRSGCECVVALVDQWYLDYGEEKWKKLVRGHLNNVLKTYNPRAQEAFEEKVEWLQDKACSRSHGLGTRVPWDKQFVIESLSDSTIYMAYYTIAGWLQNGVLDGSTPGPANITPDQLTDEVFDYIFKGKQSPAYPAQSGIPKVMLHKMRHEFEYWYPMDLRVSAKDLIGNHLTMSLFNHAAIWEDQPELWPKGYFTNGHLMINAEKMSKSTGNFMTMIGGLQEYGCDPCRFALADAGDNMLDANFEKMTADSAIRKLTTIMDWVEELIATPSLLRDGAAGNEQDDFQDRVFENAVNVLIKTTQDAYDNMKFHDALKFGFYDLWSARDSYRANLTTNMSNSLTMWFIEVSTILLAPVCPHWCEHMWGLLGKKGFVVDATFPTAKGEDTQLSEQVVYLETASNSFRSLHTKQVIAAKKAAKKAGSATDPSVRSLSKCTIQVASGYPDWQQEVLATLKGLHEKDGRLPERRGLAGVLAATPAFKGNKKKLKNAMAFGAAKIGEYATSGAACLALSMSFDEKPFLEKHIGLLTRGMGLTEVKVEVVAPTDDKNSAAPGKPRAIYH